MIETFWKVLLKVVFLLLEETSTGINKKGNWSCKDSGYCVQKKGSLKGKNFTTNINRTNFF